MIAGRADQLTGDRYEPSRRDLLAEMSDLENSQSVVWSQFL